MAVLTLASAKGGCGKTTIAQCVAGVAVRRGRSVAVIDADPNRSFMDWYAELAPYPAELRHEIDETQIAPLALELEEAHDLVIIDTAGFGNRSTVFAIGVSDLVLIPAQPSRSDLTEAAKAAALVRSTAQLIGRAVAFRIVLTKVVPRSIVSGHAQRQLEHHALPMLTSTFGDLVAFREMTFSGRVPDEPPAGLQVDGLIDELAKFDGFSVLKA